MKCKNKKVCTQLSLLQEQKETFAVGLEVSFVILAPQPIDFNYTQLSEESFPLKKLRDH